MKLSIDKRLFAIFGVFITVNSLLWMGLAILLAYVVEDEVLNKVLASHATRVDDYWQVHGELPKSQLQELTFYWEVTEVPATVRGEIAAHPGRGEIFTADATHYHYRWVTLSGGRPMLLLAEVSPWMVVTNISQALGLFLLSGFVVALLLGLLAVFAIAKITTRPIRELTQAISQSTLPSPLPHGDKQDEVGILARAMDAAIHRLQETLDREVAFTRDVSHELRTPLTTLKNAITLMPENFREDIQLRQLELSCLEIEQILNGLLALARAESLTVSSIPLRAMLESLLLKRNTILQDRKFNIDIDVADSLTVAANSKITEILLGNLLDNALYYAQPASLTIKIENSGLIFENPLPSGPVSQHPQSLGHGLSLVGRLAKAQGWSFSTEDRESHFRALLSWP